MDVQDRDGSAGDGCFHGDRINGFSLVISPTWRIIPVSQWVVSLIYKPFSPFGRGITLLRGLTNHGY